MRLLTVIPQMGAGGAEVVAGALALAAAREGHDSRLASAPGFRVAALEGVEHLPVPLDSRRPADLARAVRALRAVARDQRPDVVHAHNPKASLAARLALGPGVPLVTTMHGVPARNLAGATGLLRRTSDRVIAVSSYVAAQLEVYGFPGDRIDVVENAIEAPPHHDRAVARAELGLAPDAFVALCAARMVDQKRHDLLVEAWGRTARLTPTSVLLLAGDGPHRAAVEEAVAQHRLMDRVRLLGERTDVPRLLGASDVLVLPTEWEGLPISLLEAMMLGVPVVVSRVGGVVESLGSAVHLVEPGSAGALTAALDALATDLSGRRALGHRGRTLAEHRFAMEPMLARHREIHAQLAGSARAALKMRSAA